MDEAPVELERLPTLDKAEMMERFDGLVTDPRLRRDSLRAWVEGLGRDELYLGRYRVMTTSGSSGRKGLFVYDEPGWRAIMAQFFRYNAMVGVRPRLPRRLRIAAIGGASPVHMTRQVSATSSIGVHRVLSLPVTLPLERLVQVLNRFQPEFMNVYPSVAMRLAEEQLAGRLHLSLANMSTSSEMRTPEMTERIVEAFGRSTSTGRPRGSGAASASTTTASTSSRTWYWSKTSTKAAVRCRPASRGRGCS